MPIQETLCAITISNSKHGRGTFATRDIRQGESFYSYSGRELTYEETLTLGHFEGHAIQISPSKYLYADEPGVLINHSCEPNAGLNDIICLVALRDIIAGEEVCFDYSTSMMERSWVMPCQCGSTICRGVIEDFDMIPLETQQAYIKLGVVPTFVLELAKILSRATNPK